MIFVDSKYVVYEMNIKIKCSFFKLRYYMYYIFIV